MYICIRYKWTALKRQSQAKSLLIEDKYHLPNTNTNLSYIDNFIIAVDHAINEARPSATMILTLSAPNYYLNHCWPIFTSYMQRVWCSAKTLWIFRCLFSKFLCLQPSRYRGRWGNGLLASDCATLAVNIVSSSQVILSMIAPSKGEIYGWWTSFPLCSDPPCRY